MCASGLTVVCRLSLSFWCVCVCVCVCLHVFEIWVLCFCMPHKRWLFEFGEPFWSQLWVSRGNIHCPCPWPSCVFLIPIKGFDHSLFFSETFPPFDSHSLYAYSNLHPLILKKGFSYSSQAKPQGF